MERISRRSFLRAAGLAASALAGLLSGCGGASSGNGNGNGNDGAAAAAGVVNIGATGTLGSLNPVMMDATWITMYAVTLGFSPLVALDENAEFAYMLADDIATEDNQTYTIHLDDRAVWSDGTPVTAEDLRFTMFYMTSAKVANLAMNLGALAGTGDDGFRPEGISEIEGVQVLDEKTCTLTFKYPMNRVSFMNGYAQYLFPVPKHVLEGVPEDEFAAYPWFNAPTVVSGPYRCVEVDANHYIRYEANENYWRGAPAVSRLNLRIVEPAQLLTGLQSGEIDVVPPLLGSIVQDDYAAVQALGGVTAGYGAAYAVESLYINCERVPLKIRQAMLCALDRQNIIDGLLDGAGVLCDGFAVPDGPYYGGLQPVRFDAGRAADLVAEARAEGWDDSTRYELFLNSGEEVLQRAAAVAQSYWEAAGIHVDLNAVDLDSLMTKCQNGEGDLYGVQYTYPPVDPSWDIDYVLGSWCFYGNETVSAGLEVLWSTNDDSEYAAALQQIDACVQQDVPVIDLYVNGPLGAVRDRVVGAKATMYGCLNNVYAWTLQE